LKAQKTHVSVRPVRDRVLVTGIGCISPFGVGHESFARALLDGRGGVVPIVDFDTSACRAHRAALIQAFDAGEFIPPLKLRRIDKVGRLAIACARIALDDAGWRTDPDGSDEAGVALGTFTAGLDSTVEYLTGLTDQGPMGVPALLFSNTVSNAPASLCAIEFKLRGPNVTFNQREASSLAALSFAFGAIRNGRCTTMVSGGADRIEETFFRVHDRFGALSPSRARETDEPDPDEMPRPFDRRHNGFALGEGGFVVVLESAAVAAERGARAYGELLGSAITASPTRLNDWACDPAGLARAMRLALEDAGIRVSDVAAVFATADGAPRVDRLEAAAVADVFGADAVPVVSVKGALGECGASGAAALAAGLLTVRRATVPPTVGLRQRDPRCRVRVSAQPQRIDGDVFVVNSVASGGTNISLVIRSAGERA
jgi:3-oxoacyl-[acyl-carrier-protein] synthase II